MLGADADWTALVSMPWQEVRERIIASGVRTQPGSIVVVVRDGRVLDLTGLEPAAGVAMLRAAGVDLPDIEATVHIVRLPK